MNYWLFKSEPGDYSFQDLERDKTTPWDGVRNYQAANNMKQMRVGDLAFFYHSVKEKQIVGIMEVSKPYEPDPSDASGRFGMVHVRYIKPLARLLPLAEVKATPELSELPLVTQSRLSVMPLKKSSWDFILNLTNTILEL